MLQSFGEGVDILMLHVILHSFSEELICVITF